MECSNICNDLKDCSALNNMINTSQNSEMKEDLEGCSDNETAAVNFSTAPNTKDETSNIVSEIKADKTFVIFMKEKESSRPEMKAHKISIALSSKGSAFDNFEKFTLYPDTEELDTVTLIRELNSSNTAIHYKKKSSNSQIIYDNDDGKSNSACLAFISSIPHISNLETESVEYGHNTKNKADKETYSAITSHKEKMCSDFLRGLQDRPKEENNLRCIQTIQSLIPKDIRKADQLQHSVDHEQICNESNLYGNEKKRKELSYDIVTTFQNNLTHGTPKEVLMQTDQSNRSCTDNLSVQMAQKNKKQKSNEKCISTINTSIDPSVQNTQYKTLLISDDTVESDLAKNSQILKEDRKSLELSCTPFQLECKEVVCITQDAQKPLHFQLKNVYETFSKEFSEDKTSASLMTFDSGHQIHKPGGTIPEGSKELFKQIDSATGTNMFTVDPRQSKEEQFAPANKNPYFVMKEQFNAVLEELRLFHEISKQSEWPVSMTEETAAETSNMKDPHELQSKHDEGHYLGVVPERYDSQHLFPSHGKVVVTPSDHDRHLIEQNTLEYTPSVLVKRDLDVRGEQEVPMEVEVSEAEREDSLYSPSKVSEYKKHESREVKTWSTVFDYQTNYEKTVVDGVPSKAGPYVSRGLMKIEPLKTCTGPIRIGLSKRSKPKQLHPYLR
ncbi:uncharacterized protein LOC103180934 isoform X1 [Callorhinchus milii]|uniref:uncharacterized protein LOC103180934 isoform X1 n=1 Tax=Callorhinchus milii TaxID=7868 RepID=UPI001C3FE8C3|nr:uncharacterized protein LOC103180934 isoform X1 [Callorhinchus milii]